MKLLNKNGASRTDYWSFSFLLSVVSVCFSELQFTRIPDSDDLLIEINVLRSLVLRLLGSRRTSKAQHFCMFGLHNLKLTRSVRRFLYTKFHFCVKISDANLARTCCQRAWYATTHPVDSEATFTSDAGLNQSINQRKPEIRPNSSESDFYAGSRRLFGQAFDHLNADYLLIIVNFENSKYAI